VFDLGGGLAVYRSWFGGKAVHIYLQYIFASLSVFMKQHLQHFFKSDY
jgi:hypothetical protein